METSVYLATINGGPRFFGGTNSVRRFAAGGNDAFILAFAVIRWRAVNVFFTNVKITFVHQKIGATNALATFGGHPTTTNQRATNVHAIFIAATATTTTSDFLINVL